MQKKNSWLDVPVSPGTSKSRCYSHQLFSFLGLIFLCGSFIFNCASPCGSKIFWLTLQDFSKCIDWESLSLQSKKTEKKNSDLGLLGLIGLGPYLPVYELNIVSQEWHALICQVWVTCMMLCQEGVHQSYLNHMDWK